MIIALPHVAYPRWKGRTFQPNPPPSNGGGGGTRGSVVAHGLEGVGSRLEGSEGRLEVSTIFDRGRDGDPSVIMRISPLANSRPIAPAKSLLDMPSEWEGESVQVPSGSW